MTAAPPALDHIRLVNRLASPCILDASLVGRLDRDFLDALILLAVVQANVAPLLRDRALQRAYASFEEPPPDELRRPVSVNAISQSLRLSYETTRRRLQRLAEDGACEIGPHGVIVPARVVSSPEHMMALMRIWEQIRQLYCRLRDVGLLDEMIPPDERARWQPVTAEPPIRAVMRIASDFMLRLIDNVTGQFGSLIAGVIWFAILRGNAEPAPGLPVGLDADSPPRPVRVAELAARLAAPQETVRRYAAELAEQGFCARTRAGYVVPAEVLGRPGAMKILQDNVTDLQRMFTAFGQLGVLAEWDRQTPKLHGAA